MQSILNKARENVYALQTSVVILIVAVTLSAVGVGVGLWLAGTTIGDVWTVAGLAAVAAYSERGRVKLSERLAVSISLLPALFAAVLFGPLAAMVVFSTSMIRSGAPVPARILYASTRALTGAAAGAAASSAGSFGQSPIAVIVFAAGASSIVAPCVDTTFSSIVFYLRGLGTISAACREFLPVVLTSIPFYMPVVSLLALAYDRLSPVTLPLFFVPAIAAQRWFLLYQEQRRLTDDLVRANERLGSANLSFATALIATLDARDQYTAGHSAAVAIYARDIAARMGLSEAEQQEAHLSGLVHDVGKIGLPPGLLEKSGALTLEERRQMEKHSTIGERILRNVKTYGAIAAVVRHHHERFDGNGYPDGLQGDQIPIIARIICVADAYSAMTSDRPYRDAMPSRVARLRLAQAVGTQFDTAVVAAFEAILAGASETYRGAHDPAFSSVVASAAAYREAPADLHVAGASA